VGAAEIFAANLRTARFRSFCEDALIQLFNDPDEKVRSEAATCFNDLEGEQLGEYVRLVEAFVQSPAFANNYESLIHVLEETTAKLPDITCLVCEHFLDAVGSDASRIRTAKEDIISELIVRVYSQSTDQELRARCLDMIDRMTQREVYGLSEALALYDR